MGSLYPIVRQIQVKFPLNFKEKRAKLRKKLQQIAEILKRAVKFFKHDI